MKKIIYLLVALFSSVSTAHASWVEGLDVTANFGLPNNVIENIATNFLMWILILFTLLSVIAFVINGILFLTAGTSTDNAEKAKSMVGYSIIGITIGLSGYIIIRLVNSFLIGSY